MEPGTMHLAQMLDRIMCCYGCENRCEDVCAMVQRSSTNRCVLKYVKTDVLKYVKDEKRCEINAEKM